MKLVNQSQVEALDPAFGRMAAQMGQHAWSLPQLTMREKTFVFLAADLCTANIGFPLLTHAQTAVANGVSIAECIAAVRHLAAYAGYPTAAVALQQLQQLQPGPPPDPQKTEAQPLPDDVRAELAELDPDFAAFYAEQFDQRWSNGDLSPRERALACIAVDVLNQTLDESLSLHVDLATTSGAGTEQIHAVLLLAAEYGADKVWRALRVLRGRGSPADRNTVSP
ncbi:carboxymuconolactone decarboxylase family protein [Mycobacterium sp. CVI_P3]|uniref:Carboxymuconolactone decarboxylase family protein n=1 Tax=Mycobacterium pinniadriaticum TaxID=2994102 RepID=A0ABT3S8M7_9MYCO|nr:carboxymuconolactone decarboxylase family protein [Mycobacterium pinniadriaticum]MCX2929432.1 carboxymuconolactone decarboxylase family protein [Mycobacterium pinniadriaticum]MCX2935856.1 carboxymuconolactone decarboxylase family protein [Mycobacterium pinniadriaticum]